MNQEKTGKFILELRKESNMTQRELAEKIGVTDRAISKWENGRGMPDLSLLMPLCEILNISVNELLSGERIEQNDYREKSEENIISTIEYTERKIKKNKNTFKIIITAVFVIALSLILMFFTDVRRMNQQRPVVFSTWGYKYAPAEKFNENEIITAIKEYLTEKGDSEPKHHNNEKSFASINIYLTVGKKQDKDIELYYVYAWVLQSKYYTENGELKEDSGYSVPCKFTVEEKNSFFTVTESRMPRDGSFYSEDMKIIFPADVRCNMENADVDGTFEKLRAEVLEKAKLYFHIPSEDKVK